MDVSDFLANLQGDDATPEQDPDWLKELNADDGSKEASEKQGSQSSDDPFAFLTTPNKSPFKGSQQASTPVQSAKPHGDTTSTPKKQTPKGKTSGATAGVDMPGRVTIKNPDKIVFNRLLVELPHKDSDCVDLSGDTGAVGRFTFCDRVRSQTRGGPSAAASDPEAEEAPPSPGGDAGAAGAPPAAGDGRGDQKGAAATEEGLVLDLKGVKFDARIAALAGTACVVNIGPSGAKVEAVFNEFLQLEETSLFEDYEEVTDGTLEGWNVAEPDAVAGDGSKPPGKKPRKAPVISSGRVSKATKRKPAGKGKAGKGKTPQKGGARKR